MFRRGLLFAIAFLASYAACCQMAHVKGVAPSYSGDSLTFQTYTDFVTYSEEYLEKVRVGADGRFEGKIGVVEPTFVFVSLGAQRGYFFVEPGKSYELVLPTKVPKTEEDRLNPFFKEETFHIGLASCPKSDLNFLISSFDMQFNEKFNLIAQESFQKKGRVKIDSSVFRLDTLGRHLNSPYFEAYKRYRMGLLKHLVMMYKSKGISDQYFLNQPILYSNPSYMELFNQIYDRFFLFHNNTTKGDNVGSCIGAASLSRLKKVLSKDSVLKNDQLLELVILKGIYDGFYEDNFSRKSLLLLLDSLYFTTSVPEHKAIATNIREKVIRLLPGYFPPELQLLDVNGKLVSLDQFRGKFIYLNFCSVNSYTCLQDFQLLEQIYKKYGKFVEIVSISTDPDVRDFTHFVTKKGYKWTFLHYGRSPSVVNRYDIRAYPTYFLIGPEGKMEVSPAPSPHEKLEFTLFNLLRSRDML